MGPAPLTPMLLVVAHLAATLQLAVRPEALTTEVRPTRIAVDGHCGMRDVGGVAVSTSRMGPSAVQRWRGGPPAGRSSSQTAAPAPFTTCRPPAEPPPVIPASGRAASLTSLAQCASTDLELGRWRDVQVRIAQAERAIVALTTVERRPWQGLLARLDATRRVDGGQWSALVGEVLAHEDALRWVGPLVRGVAAARASWAAQDAGLLARARSELSRLEGLARAAGPISEEERARLLVQGAIAGAQYERDEMQLLLDAAHDLERRLLPDDGTRLPVILALELEADLLRITDRYAAASERYQDVLVEWPRRIQARVGLAESYRRLGNVREAEAALAQARELWEQADPEARAIIK